MPVNVRSLPIDARGYPVPWFVQWFQDGKPTESGVGAPDFRVIDGRKKILAWNQLRCWLCGKRLGSMFAFVVGPMCAINRTSGEPPCHRDCAVFAAIACPFMVRPKAERREANLPTESEMHPAGLRRNPGVALVWLTSSYRIRREAMDPKNPAAYLVEMGPAYRVLFFAEGRPATRAEVLESIETGLPLLRRDAEQEGEAALTHLEKLTAEAMRLLPAA